MSKHRNRREQLSMLPDYVARVLSLFDGVKEVTPGPGMVRQWKARCPAHNPDRNPSLSFGLTEDGKIVIHDFTGCSLGKILQAVGLTEADLFPPHGDRRPSTHHRDKRAMRSNTSRSEPNATQQSRSPSRPTELVYASAQEAIADYVKGWGEPSARWEYRNAAGEIVGYVLRWDTPSGKEIRPVSLYPEGWKRAAMPSPRPLYRLSELAQAQLVLVVEGEKCADAAASIGFTATTSAGGSSAPHLTDWSPLSGKEVFVIPDNDSAGRRYASAVVELLSKLSPPVRVALIELPGLQEGQDIADWVRLNAAQGPEELRRKLLELAQQVEIWEPPLPDQLPFEPFPVDLLPEPCQGFVRAGSVATYCDPSFVALPLLVAAAAAIGGTRRLRLHSEWHVPSILWGMLIGESGTGKTPAQRLALGFIRRRHAESDKLLRELREQHEEAKIRYEVELAEWRRNGCPGEKPRKPDPPTVPSCIVRDVTIEALVKVLESSPRGVLLDVDELDSWVRAFDRYSAKAGGERGKWLSFYSAEDVTTDRKTSDRIFVRSPIVSIVGGIQPGVLQSCFSREDREAGFLARFILAFPPRRKGHWTEAEIHPAVKAAVGQVFDRLFSLDFGQNEYGDRVPVTLELDRDAKLVWIEFFNRHVDESQDLEGDLAAAWHKLTETAARLALVIHYLRWAAGEPVEELLIDAETLRRSVGITEWLKYEVRRVYGWLAGTDEQRKLQKLIDWIATHGGAASAREVRKGCRWLRAPGRAEEALEAVVKSGLGVWETNDGVRGRHTQRVRLVQRGVGEILPCRRNSSTQKTPSDMSAKFAQVTGKQEDKFADTTSNNSEVASQAENFADRDALNNTPPQSAGGEGNCDKGNQETESLGSRKSRSIEDMTVSRWLRSMIGDDWVEV